jgi:hypothetical protein
LDTFLKSYLSLSNFLVNDSKRSEFSPRHLKLTFQRLLKKVFIGDYACILALTDVIDYYTGHVDLEKSLVLVTRITDQKQLPRRSRSRSLSKRRRGTAVEREMQERIDRENRILLKKILEQHHGVRRSLSIPPPTVSAPPRRYFERLRDFSENCSELLDISDLPLCSTMKRNSLQV